MIRCLASSHSHPKETPSHYVTAFIIQRATPKTLFLQAGHFSLIRTARTANTTGYDVRNYFRLPF